MRTAKGARMKSNSATLLVGTALLAFAVSAASAQNTVNVHFNPASTTVAAGNSFAVQLVADIPSPVVGWGLDLSYDTSLLSLESIEMGPLWFTASAADGDGLAGLAFPSPISGQSTLLPVLHFKARST